MQVCHGKEPPLLRIKPSDNVVYYSPTATFGGKDVLRAFTAAGIVKAGSPYRFDMGDGFIPFRRDIQWYSTQDIPIKSLLDRLDFTRSNKNWGYDLRFGLVALTEHDCCMIMAEMQANITAD